MPPSKKTAKPGKKVYDVISIGDATLDTFIQIDDASVLCNLQKDVCLICLSYADKIPVGKPTDIIGGNAANNAVGSSRLGLRAAFYSVVGDDEIGRKVMETVKREGVSTEYVVAAKKQQTNRSTVLNYKAERTILVYHADREYKLPKFKGSKWIYLTSMGKNHALLHQDLVNYLKTHDTRLAFNPGTHQILAGLEKLRPLLELTDVLFVNKEEARRIIGEIADMKELLAAVHHVGPRIVVITDGENGSYAYDGHKYWKTGITDTPVVERTGAGDGFATAFTAATIHGKDIPEALHWGTLNSASVIMKVGPEAGLLTKTEMARWLRKYPHIRGKLF